MTVRLFRHNGKGDPAGTCGHIICNVLNGRALAVVILAVALSLHGLLSSPAEARQGFAAIAVDARSGKVLFARNADSPRIPASVTKVMTLYLLFHEIRTGRLSLSSRIRISRHAASMQPSKLWLKPGQTLTVDQAIRALVTKSANDVAVAVAEAIAGTERAFARRMTTTARAMGMTRTTFRNASGLPYPPNVTTARDLATLSLRIQRDFPRLYKRYFALKYFTFRGRRHRNHNHLLWRVRGMDGLKTGYTRAAGYNLAATVHRNGKRVVAVVLGAPSARMRNAYMARLLERTIRRRDLLHGTRIAAVAGVPPGLSPARVAALNRRANVRKRISLQGSSRRTPVKPISRPALPSGQLAKLAQRATAFAVADTVSAKVKEHPPVPRRRPQVLANVTRTMNGAPAKPETAKGNPAQRATAEKAANEKPIPIREAPRVTTAGSLFVTVRPQGEKTAHATKAVSHPKNRQTVDDTALYREGQDEKTHTHTKSAALQMEHVKTAGAVAMQVVPEPAATDAVKDDDALMAAKRPQVTESAASADDHGMNADVSPAPSERKVASIDPSAAFVPSAPARVIKVDRKRREMVVAPVRLPMPSPQGEHVANTARNESMTAFDVSTSAKDDGKARPISDDGKEDTPVQARNSVLSEHAGMTNSDQTSAPVRDRKDHKNEKERTPELARHLKSWNIQLGAFPAQEGARKRLMQARRVARHLLRGKPAFTMVFERNGAIFYRARFSGFDRRGAFRACRALKKRRIPCFALAPAAGRS